MSMQEHVQKSHHSNFVLVYGTDETGLKIVMEKCDGMLKDLIKARNFEFKPAEAAYIILQIIFALQYMHHESRMLMHRSGI